jgi:hypothetical protein
VFQVVRVEVVGILFLLVQQVLLAKVIMVVEDLIMVGMDKVVVVEEQVQ